MTNGKIFVSEVNHHNKVWGGLSLFYFMVFIFTPSFNVYAEVNQTQTTILEQQQHILKNNLIPPLSHTQIESKPTAPPEENSADDTTCLVINQVELININDFPNAVHLKRWAQGAEGRCLGDKGLTALRDKLQWQMAISLLGLFLPREVMWMALYI
ncbi:putative hemolysin activator protein [Yersinia pekkanenii]|uniref:Hemolysin activator protein n=1 Tax=Yersinia pekkanenii TaxID=1288385 RepID=A0A0T9QPU2_9GAMM|nr:putative hemolysin activator protein [Yersinia pekkanenii]CRY66335.1 putative hemolysin activator protein [Yersinia pekkanenii]